MQQIRFATHAELKAAQLPDCACGHPASVHGLLPQHVLSSGCFRTFWKDSKADRRRVFAGACPCDTYRPTSGA